MDHLQLLLVTLDNDNPFTLQEFRCLLLAHEPYTRGAYMLRGAPLMLFLERNLRDGTYALHGPCVCMVPPAGDVFQMLLALNPGATLTANGGRNPPLHLLLDHNSNCGKVRLSAVHSLVRKFPLPMHFSDKERLPLHVSCCGWFRIHIEVVRFLLGVAFVRNRYSRLPIRVIAKSGLVQATSSFIDMFPGSLVVQDARGRCPLHEACSMLGAWQTAQVILASNLTVVSIQDSDGNLPIHYSCRKDSPFHLVQRMVELYPDSLQVQTLDGELPLHCACDPSFRLVREHSRDKIHLLVNIYPYALLTRRHTDGQTPLQLAFHPDSEVSVETKLFLLEQHELVVQAQRDAVEFVADMFLDGGYPGLVEHIWELVRPEEEEEEPWFLLPPTRAHLDMAEDTSSAMIDRLLA